MIQVCDVNGNKGDAVKIPFKARKMVPSAYSCAVKVLRQNWRQGTVACKGRSDVAFSTKKPWKQKGTGRARAGSRRSPLWRSGGITFGPQPRTRTLRTVKKQRFLVFNNIFQSLYDAGKISCLDMEIKDKPSAKMASKALRAMKLDKTRVVLFVSPADEATVFSFRNLPNVKLLTFDEPNAFSLTHGQQWVVLKKDIDSFKQMVSRWH